MIFGDYNHSIEYGSKALKIREDIFGENHPEYAITLSNLSLAYIMLGDYIKALEYGEKVNDIFKNVFGEKHPLYATSLNNLASIYSKFGDYDKAILFETKVVEIRKEIFGENNPDYAMSLNNLADFYSRKKDYAKAIEYGVKSIDNIKAALGSNHPNYSMFLQNLALYYFDLGDYKNATDYFQRGLEIDKANILIQTASLSNNQRAMYWNKYSCSFTDLFPLITYKSNLYTASDLYNLSALFSKGLLLTTEIELNRLIKESGDEKAMKIFEELRILRLQLQRLYEIPISERSLNVDSLTEVANQLEKTLVERSKVYGDFTKKLRTTWKDVQNSLSEDEIAVEFISFPIFGTDSTMIAALTLRKDSKEPKLIPLFDLAQLSVVSDTDHYLCSEVTHLIWEPLRNEIQDIRRIFFSPAGVIHRIGIEYLPGMESYDIYRLSTTREIIDMKTKSSPLNKNKALTVLYGGINYDISNSLTSERSSKEISDFINDEVSQQLSITLHRAFVDSLNLRGMEADYLPSTLAEVQRISSSLKNSNLPTVVHIGSDATEKSVKSLTSNTPAILHISTHGFYFSKKQARKEDRPSFLSIEDDESANMEDKALARSGLLFAGANVSLRGQDIPTDVDDGILTAVEISRLDLRGLELVVLSACETGKGDILQGEGVFGLQRGFKKAGVQTILMSLWKVSDVSTEMLMTDFYQNICNGKNIREALRMAQQKVRDYKDADGNCIFQDPHYWAGFVILD